MRSSFVGATCLVMLLVHCSGDDETPRPQPSAVEPVIAKFTVPASLDELSDEHYYDHPWPSDLRRDPDGKVHFEGFYNPRRVSVLDHYVNATRGLLDGFSPAAAAYFRFSGAIDPSSLPPSPQAALDPKASLQIIDVDPSSPERGSRKLLQHMWKGPAGVYWLENTLAVLPAHGYPLRPKTRYAIVATRALRASDGRAVAPSPELEEVLGVRPASPRTQGLRDGWAPSIAEVVAAGVDVADIAHLTVFTTNDPTSEVFAVVDDVHANVPAPTVDPSSWAAKEQTPDYDVYEGTYAPSPNYQAGTLPFFDMSDGGGFVFDAEGKPVLQGTFSLRFVLVVPNATKCPPPADGYPITLYAHGTGGDYRSIVRERNSMGQALAERCLASMGVDQIFHGDRPGAPAPGIPNREGLVALTYFNLNNPIAARTNGRQSAIDVVQQARLFTESHVAIPANVSRTGEDIRFDGTRLTFFGHSQGGLNGPIFLAADDQARGAVLSGAGSLMTIALLEKTSPEPSVADAVRGVLQLTRPEEAAELNPFHPALNLAQALVDATDPIHYAPMIIQRPRPGHASKSVLLTEGVRPDGTGDSYAPPHGIEIGSVALGLPRLLPGVRPVLESGFSGIADVQVPPGGLSGNLADGRATGGLAQFVPPPGRDGHFIVFDVPEARALVTGFCRNLADDPTGRIPPL